MPADVRRDLLGAYIPLLDDAPDVFDWLRFRFGYRFNINTLHIQDELVILHNQYITLQS
jgi:hypothetical protein